ncbi:hypothetical protein L226DRAFT_474387 [Lentinus tigrinus ALCF2SS1-7]|uniref:DUF4218 domain-containing protein n=1 Tax=Lentinus tigrinus ALCF2SS1-6 TaxID=1328759 RepID=A0A5C2S988_9APHY|nr:hypothetical protein L227DRAFT_506184 [Lentinus tigrinus ALCF2SS1-6]RPD67763.1 hypothetical protein L226DRAFT_474446 [Lentinus tigrinus ALCF2SS1-7]RPD67800.1 hypothetical protein L226DRAFT_474387 [Lentinus tigrinus ALCF2SS1-7]
MHNIFLGELRHHWRDLWKIGRSGGQKGANSALHTPQEQETQLRRIRTAMENRVENTLASMRKDYLSGVARFNRVIGHTSGNPTRREYAVVLLEWVDANGIHKLELPPPMAEATQQYRLPYDEPPKPTRFAPSSQDLLQIQEDISATIVPSWLEKVPSTFGTAKGGKLKADHWRTACTVNAVITLVRRWGTANSDPEELEALKNYIHLVVAADFASRRSMTPVRAAAYEHHMEAYLRGLIRIYHHTLVPNHHLALHLRRFLDAFGPVHGWWTYPFERYNGLLQRLKTNFKAAEMATTFMRYWYIGTALRWLIRTVLWPSIEEYDVMVKSFERAFSDTVRGTRVTDILASNGADLDKADFMYDRHEESALTADVYQMLLEHVNAFRTPAPFLSAHSPANDGKARLHPAGQFVSSIHQKGIRFATRAKGLRDSFILFRSDDGMVRAGQISQIFYHHRIEENCTITQPYLIVDAYSDLAPVDIPNDPYRRFPELDTCLYYDRFEQQPQLIPAHGVVAHFAAFKYIPDGMNERCIVARSLDRVSELSFQIVWY